MNWTCMPMIRGYGDFTALSAVLALIVTLLTTSSPVAAEAKRHDATIAKLEREAVKIRNEMRSVQARLSESLQQLSDTHVAILNESAPSGVEDRKAERQSRRIAKSVFKLEGQLRTLERKLRRTESKIGKLRKRATSRSTAKTRLGSVDPIDAWLVRKQAEQDAATATTNAIRPKTASAADAIQKPTRSGLGSDKKAGDPVKVQDPGAVAQEKAKQEKSDLKGKARAEKQKREEEAQAAEARERKKRQEEQAARLQEIRDAKEQARLRKEAQLKAEAEEAEKKRQLKRKEKALRAQERAEYRAKRDRELAHIYPWRFSLGVGYRDLDDVDFGAVTFPNFGTQATGVVSDGPDSPSTVNGPYGVQGVSSRLIPVATDPPMPNTTPFQSTREGQKRDPDEDLDEEPPIFVDLDYIRYNGDSDNFDGTAGLILGIDRYLTFWDKMILFFTAGIHVYDMDLSQTQGDSQDPGSFTAQSFSHQVVDSDDDILDGVIFEQINPALGAPTLGPSTGTTFSVNNRADLSLVVVDAGVRFTYEPRRLNLAFAVGPTLSFIELDVSQTINAAWQNPNDPLGEGKTRALDPLGATATIEPGNFTQTRTDSDQDVTAGLYLSLELLYEVNLRWGVEGSIRYDYVDSDPKTTLAEVDLSGIVGQLKLFYRF